VDLLSQGGERKAAAPLLNLDLLKNRGILGANECLLAYGACNAGAVLLVTLYLQEGRGSGRFRLGCASSRRRSGPSP
jgi:hypothetical protein